MGHRITRFYVAVPSRTRRSICAIVRFPTSCRAARYGAPAPCSHGTCCFRASVDPTSLGSYRANLQAALQASSDEDFHFVSLSALSCNFIRNTRSSLDLTRGVACPLGGRRAQRRSSRLRRCPANAQCEPPAEGTVLDHLVDLAIVNKDIHVTPGRRLAGVVPRSHAGTHTRRVDQRHLLAFGDSPAFAGQCRRGASAHPFCPTNRRRK